MAAGGDKVGAVIVAAGKGQRMGGVDKVFSPIGGRPLIAWVLDAFQGSPSVDEVVVVLGAWCLERGRGLVGEGNWTKATAICEGGDRRQDSVREGLGRLSDCRWAIIHDGARPCVTPSLIEKVLAAAVESGAAIAAVPVTDTIKAASEDGFILGTPERDGLWAAQTPQAFRYDLICEAHRRPVNGAWDDSLLVEELGHRVKVSMGAYDNIKVTTPQDLALAEVLLGKRCHGEG
ncbi:2-C-methyl-D-erythritol 4-phosphate cytidylyltransferase [Chloroflexota bacterium]